MFNIENDSINKKLELRSISGELIKSITIKEPVFEVHTQNPLNGYYMLQKDDEVILLYLQRDDDLKLSFDWNNFYSSMAFTGRGSAVNQYLLSLYGLQINSRKKGKQFYEKSLYHGNEQDYLSRIDQIYKSHFNRLFSSQFDKRFVDEEMKNLQYGYSLDLLKFEDAKKYYKFQDSVSVSPSFLEPLIYIDFDNAQLYDKYYAYKELSVLKWKKDIERTNDYAMMSDIVTSIRNPFLKQAVLEDLYFEMNATDEVKTKDYYKLIKENSSNLSLLSRAKETYEAIRHVEAEKNLSKFNYLDTEGNTVQLSEFKGQFIVLYVWASFCKDCIKDLQKLQKLAEKYAEKDVVFIGVSVDKPEQVQSWKVTLEENKLKGHQLFFEGSKSKFIQTYDIGSIPNTLLLSVKGVVINNDNSKTSVKKTLKLLDEALKKE